MDPLEALATIKTGVAAKKWGSLDWQAELSEETYDQRIIAIPFITLHSPQTSMLRQIP